MHKVWISKLDFVEKHSPVNNEVWRRMRLNLRETLLFVQLEFSHLEVKKHKAHIDFLELFHLGISDGAAGGGGSIPR